MKLKLKNVGMITEANIEFNGITIIAGENSTGKSTVGKMLYCVFNSFYHIEDQVEREKQITISRLLRNSLHELRGVTIKRAPFLNMAENIIENKDIYLENKNKLESDIEDIFMEMDPVAQDYLTKEFLSNLAEKVIKFLLIPAEDIYIIILQRRLEAEFNMQVGHINHLDTASSVSLTVKNNCINFDLINNSQIVIHNYISLVKELMYIDDPYALDDLDGNNYYVGYSGGLNHRDYLLDMLARENKTSALEEIEVKNKLKTIMTAMNAVCDGELSSTEERGNFVYRSEQLKETLTLSNLSTGMKNFLIIKQLLLNGSINDNGIIVLDEPEIHLHPEWQLRFAEIIVLIQKEFGINILLNTHSPYFLNAIEVYSKKYRIDDNCKYYMTERVGEHCTIEDVTNHVESIYARLASPLQTLENMEFMND